MKILTSRRLGATLATLALATTPAEATNFAVSSQSVGGFVSTGRCERVETMRGITSSQTEFTHIEVAATVRTFAENEHGSIVLCVNGLTLVWDSAKKNDLQIIPPHQLPRGFECAPNPVGKQELSFKVLIFKPREQTQVVRLLALNPATRQWEIQGDQRCELPGLVSWLQNEAEVTAGAANAEIEGFYVKTVRAPTLLMIAGASSIIHNNNHRGHGGHRGFLFFSAPSVFSVVKNVFGFVLKGGLS